MPVAARIDERGLPPQTAPQAAQQSLSLVIPAYNEAATIRQAVREAVAALDQLPVDYEILVIDDGSTDGTADLARAEAVGPGMVRVLSLPHNAGYGAALRHGFQEARHEWVAFTDADCQFHLHELDRLLLLTHEYPLVCGYRIDRQDPWLRKVYSRGFNILVGTLLGTSVRDCDCALKVFRRDLVQSLGLESRGFFLNAELLSKARLAGVTAAEVGVTHRERCGGASKVSIRHVVPVLKSLAPFWWTKVLFPQPAPAAAALSRESGKWPTVASGVLLAVFAAVLMLSKLSFPLIDPDESRYARIACEMFDSGDYVLPRLRGKPYLDKPPLLYWLTAAAYSVLGVTDAAARLTPALAAIGTVISTYWLGMRLVGPRAAWIGGLSLLASGGFLLTGRFLFMDTLLTCFTTIALLGAWCACREPRFQWRWWVLSAVACGLGMLTKGPIAPVLCLAPLAASLWLTGTAPLRPRHLIAYAGIAGAVALPWFALITFRNPMFWFEFIWQHHLVRFVEGMQRNEPWWYYIPVLFLAMLPASALFPVVVAFLTSRRDDVRRLRTWDLGFLVLASAWPLMLFSTSSCKLPPYILPAFPAICLLLGRVMEVVLTRATGHRYFEYVRQRSPRDLCLMLGVSLGVLLVVDACLCRGHLAARIREWLICWTGVAAAAAVLAVALSRWLKWSSPAWTATTVFALAVTAYGLVDFYPAIAEARSTVKPVVTFCQNDLLSSKPVICVCLTRQRDSFSFYLGRNRVQSFELEELDKAAAALKQAPQAVLLARAEDLPELQRRLPKKLRLVPRGGCRYIHVLVPQRKPEALSGAKAAQRRGARSLQGIVPARRHAGQIGVADSALGKKVAGRLSRRDDREQISPFSQVAAAEPGVGERRRLRK